MKEVTFYFRNLEANQSLHSFVLPFLTFMVDLTIGEILNIWEESRICKINLAIGHEQKVSFLQMHK